MRKILVVAKREYLAMVRTKTFIFTMVLMPVLMFGSVFLQTLLEGRLDLADQTIVVLDGTGELYEGLESAVEQRNAVEVLDRESGRQVDPKYRLERGPEGPVNDEVRFELSERVSKDEIFGFVEILPDAIELQSGIPETRAYVYGEGVGSGSLRRWIFRALNEAIQARRLAKAGIDLALVRRATQPTHVEGRGLYKKDSAGHVLTSDQTGQQLASIVPMILMLLMFMSIMIVAQPLLQSVIEEKQQRIAEVLLGSASPFDLMAGKLVGNVGVALTIIGVYGLGGYWLADFYGYQQVVPTHLAGWFVVYEVIAVFLYGSVFIAIGAACSELREAQSLLTPIMIVLVMPLMVAVEVLRDPMSTFSLALSLFPPGTPMLMLMRMAASDAIPLWQPLLGILLVLVSALVAVWAAGRIFRIGILVQGKAPKVSELIRWIVRG